jgi:hypothetical protein
MQELNVILDPALKSLLNNGSVMATAAKTETTATTATTGITLENQLFWDRKNPSNYYAQYEQNSGLITDNQTEHHLVNGFLYAYNNHLPLKLRPDDIQLLIQGVIAVCVNNNAEKFRSLFVSHKGQMKISVENPQFDPDFFCEVFADAMKSTLKEPVFVDKFTGRFSTTTSLITTVSNMMLMNTLKKYFSFEMVLGCGIPNVILCGTQGDWKILAENYVYFKTFLKGTELDNWFKHFDTIIEMFLEMRMLSTTGSVPAPTHIKELWKRVISYVPEGSGGDKILGGWIRLFIPYTSENKLIGGLDRKIKCLDISIPDPQLQYRNIDCYAMQAKLKEFYIASGWSTVPKSVVLTPAVLIDYDETKYDVEFNSGFYESCFKNGCVSMNIGFKMTENSTLKNDILKAAYIKQGVKEEYGGMIRVPKALEPEINNLLKVFNAGGWCR